MFSFVEAKKFESSSHGYIFRLAEGVRWEIGRHKKTHVSQYLLNILMTGTEVRCVFGQEISADDNAQKMGKQDSTCLTI